ncbi:MAG: hypothetical protein O2955_13960 [Planctomycetota bacterium]|nr:hypothetical protein [Planctomycetota bacterium]MDA1213616.1 hypothetical protein [Planctomycetota bacterium]
MLKHWHSCIVGLIFFCGGYLHSPLHADDERGVRIDVGSQLQLMWDDLLIDSMQGLELRLHSPRPAEIVIEKDKPWEDSTMYDPTVIKDGEKYRMWYRTNFNTSPFYTGYAESGDGITWTKPNLGLFEFKGSKENNIVWSSGEDRKLGYVLSIFKDENPDAKPEERYKGASTIAGGEGAGMYPLVSPDGIHWTRVSDKPMLTGGLFDAHNIVLWDAPRQQYLAYPRGFFGPIRHIRRASSKDFVHWTPLEFIDLGDGELEHLYKNAAIPYYRRPDILLMFPKRFMESRKPDPDWVVTGVSDIVFMFSRDTVHWDRRFREAFIRPGLDQRNWHDRAIEAGPTLVPTGPGEMSLYYMERYRTDDVMIRRGVLREDGIASIHAKFAGGEFVTKPLVFAGNRLSINYSTSAAGSVQIELQDAEGNRLAETDEMYGDEIEHVVKWKANADVGSLAGKPVRMKTTMKDADLFSFRFLKSDSR